MFPLERLNVFVQHLKDERSLLKIQQSLLLASISSPWKVLIRAAVLFVYCLNVVRFKIVLPPCCLQPFAHLPDFTPFLNSLPSHYSDSVVPLCFPTYYVRCDASIAKLSADVSSGELRVIRLQQEMAALRSALDVRLKELEVKVRRCVNTDKGFGRAKIKIFIRL